MSELVPERFDYKLAVSYLCALKSRYWVAAEADVAESTVTCWRYGYSCPRKKSKLKIISLAERELPNEFLQGCLL